MSEELKPCPFCGGDAYFSLLSGRRGGVRCRSCGAGAGLFKRRPAAIAAWNARPEPEWTPTHRHPKRGTAYRVLGCAILQTEKPAGDYTNLAIYEDAYGEYWARPVTEFNDGRFEALSSSKMKQVTS